MKLADPKKLLPVLLILAACAKPEMPAAERTSREEALTLRQMEILQLSEADATARYGAPAATETRSRDERALTWKHADGGGTCDLILLVNTRGEVIEANYAASEGDAGLMACAHWL